MLGFVEGVVGHCVMASIIGFWVMVGNSAPFLVRVRDVALVNSVILFSLFSEATLVILHL